jgi:hypothetical protein
MRKWFVVLAPAAALLLLAGCGTMGGMDESGSMDDGGMAASDSSMKSSDESMAMAESMGASFTVKVEVVDGSATPIAPVAWAVYSGDNPLFTPETAVRINGLEALAEDGDSSGVAKALADSMDVVESGVAAVPSGAMDAGPAGPGHAYSFHFTASEGQRLGFATMYVQSNDLFFAPAGEGLELFDMGKPISGDVTSRILLYDAGTEVNERPGSGAHQAPRQMGPNSGKDEMAAVRPIGEVSDGYMYPAVNRVIRVTVSAM